MKLIALLHRSTLRLFVLGGKKDGGYEEIKIDFDKSVVLDSDIFDQEKFSFDIKNVLIKRPELQGNDIIFLLPPEKAFVKRVSVKNSSVESETARFFTDLPVSESESNLIVTTDGSEVEFQAVPKKLLDHIDKSLAKINYKVSYLPLVKLATAIFASKERQLLALPIDYHLLLVATGGNRFQSSLEIPLEKFKTEDQVVAYIRELKEKQLSGLTAVTFLAGEESLKSIFEKADFTINLLQLSDDLFATIFKLMLDNRKEITASTFANVSQTEVKKASQIQWPWALGLLFLFGLAAAGYWYFQNQPEVLAPAVSENTSQSPAASPAATLTPVPEATSSPQAITKATVRMRVLNGSGRSGDAASLKETLTPLGFSQIETDTAPSQGQRATRVLKSERVPETITQELKTALEKEFVQVTIVTETPTGADIEITTGTRH